jgi:hypothetical protein
MVFHLTCEKDSAFDIHLPILHSPPFVGAKSTARSWPPFATRVSCLGIAFAIHLPEKEWNFVDALFIDFSSQFPHGSASAKSVLEHAAPLRQFSAELAAPIVVSDRQA